jgi:hypothetical protein
MVADSTTLQGFGVVGAVLEEEVGSKAESPCLPDVGSIEDNSSVKRETVSVVGSEEGTIEESVVALIVEDRAVLC